MSDEVEPSGSLAWKTNNIFFGSRRKGREARSETAHSASGFRGSAPEGASSASAHLDSCIAFSDK